MITAPHLNPGDRVGIAAPSGLVRKVDFLKGLRFLEGWGLKPVYRKDLFSAHRYFAGSHRRRLRELQMLMDRDDIKAILFPRGGFGLHYILPELNFAGLRKHPKRIIGYSDLTMLLDRIRSKAKLVTYYGPTVNALGVEKNARVHRDYRRILLGNESRPYWNIANDQIMRHGRVAGEIVGGCLTLLSMSVGTPFEFEAQNRILLLEDINEAPYRFERLMLHLKQSRKLSRVRGLIISASETGGKRSPHREWKRMLHECLSDFKGPILVGFPCGHARNPNTLPLGRRMSLDTQGRRLHLIER